jgi:plasmid stabilization system protein ParE
MAFRVEISPQAFADLDEIARHIKQQGSVDLAEEWFNGIIMAIRTLADLPYRCPLADESADLGQDVHVLVHGRRNRKYRVYFSIQEKTSSTGRVCVLHVRHWARKSLNLEQLKQLKIDARK